MDPLLDICTWKKYDEKTRKKMLALLKQGIPATVSGEDEKTPLHLLVENLPVDASAEDVQGCCEMIQILFQRGGGWVHLDCNNESPGCIALRRGVARSVYDMFVNEGVRSEILLRKLGSLMAADSDSETAVEDEVAANTNKYLQDELEYREHDLITSEKDGVMMDWEDGIMKRSAEVLCSKKNGCVLNVGFGMGIIDRYIQSHKPSKHYIVEAHPQVLQRMRDEGWYEKEGVVVLEGKWQDTLPKLLEENVVFDGIYYDTFSEKYDALLEFFDTVVGLLNGDNGVFSFFNGLGADRQVCYDVYCKVVELDLAEFGLSLEYEPMEIDKQSWTHIKRSYWNVNPYMLPICHF
ncbi:hypothetical protein CANCADRAFT_31270 [Tortispora caseinolytica NRRL Y-17796]|uniref:Arginine N-methyltransferase 2 n=1 Tax=Tortispora caseinolytica NRRL Y-17796 TaxID=767744 RepID=A0A1E4TES9_9ASCO|nr:hypothetical protein CANCADRAFT_31270 [Tortispora caseinolytica NRRL Y-17796]